MTQTHRQGLGIILLLAFLSAVGPFSIDTYLPSLPNIAAEFNISSAITQHSVSSFFFGLAAGQLLAGPLSDRFGRRPILLGGFGLFFIATIVCALAPNVTVLIFARALQGLAASASPAAGRAVVRDLWSGNDAAKAMSYVVMAMSVAPLIAPSIGGIILLFFDWRMIFWLLLIFAGTAVVLILLYLPETNGPEKRDNVRLINYFKAYRKVLQSKISWAYFIGGGLSTASMFAYITAAPFVYIELFGVSQAYFGAFFAVNVIGLFLGNWLNSRLVTHYGYHKLLVVGSTISLSGALFLLAGAYFQWHNLLTLVIGLFSVVAPVSFVSSNSNVGVLNLFPKNAGAASALFGLFQFGLGACASLLVGFLHNGTELAMATVIVLTASGSFVAALWILLFSKPELAR